MCNLGFISLLNYHCTCVRGVAEVGNLGKGMRIQRVCGFIASCIMGLVVHTYGLKTLAYDVQQPVSETNISYKIKVQVPVEAQQVLGIRGARPIQTLLFEGTQIANLPSADIGVLKVRRVSVSEIVEIMNWTDLLTERNVHPKAFYQYASETMFILDDFDFENPSDRSLLLHELVHRIQHVLYGPIAEDDPQGCEKWVAREYQAAIVQTSWFRGVPYAFGGKGEQPSILTPSACEEGMSKHKTASN